MEDSSNSNPIQDHLAVSEGWGSISDKEQCGGGGGGGLPWKGLILGWSHRSSEKGCWKALILGWTHSRWVSHFSLEKGTFFHSFRVCKRSFSVHIIMTELSLYQFPENVFFASRYNNWDTRVLKLDAVTQVYAVLSLMCWWCSWSWSQWNAQFVQCRLYHIHRGCCKHQVLFN